MLPKLKLSIYLVKRLEQVKQQCSGCLFGVFYGESTLLVMGFNLETTFGQLNYEEIQHKFPAELDLCGIVKFGNCSDAEAHLNEIFKDVDITDNPVLLHCELGTLVGLKASYLIHGKFVEVDYEILETEELHRDFCFTRLKCNWTIYAEPTIQSINSEIQALRKMITGGRLAFNIQPTKVFIMNTGVHGNSYPGGQQQITNDSVIACLLQSIREVLIKNLQQNDCAEQSIKSKKRSMQELKLTQFFGVWGSDYDIINVDILWCKTRDVNDSIGDNAGIGSGNGMNGGQLASMGMRVLPKEHKFSVPIEVDTLAIVYKYTKITRLYDILIESICRALSLSESCIAERLENSDNKELMVAKMYNFLPKELGHFISCCYLESISDANSSMQDQRKRLHRQFALPLTRPYFRRSNACIFQNTNTIINNNNNNNNNNNTTVEDVNQCSALINVHCGIRSSGIIDGIEYLVQGNYRYYHYMQQQISDKGWGCAYRSLQTICSWFVLQGYADNKIPTHLEVQEYLVKIGDKPLSFKGSNNWIGSAEVSMCLQGFVRVDSKILHVSSGAEMLDIASDLIAHFQSQGTPVMIGGGVLAHTIIGIAYSAQNGQVKFLILDPHYTGDDDLHVIQGKGWCGWKGIDFWDKKSYYNLCLPQRPILF